jgi:hypothetical protein
LQHKILKHMANWRWLFPFLLSFAFSIDNSKKARVQHPYYMSVTEINYNGNEKQLEVACKIFTDDFETTLESACNCKIDLYHAADTTFTHQQIAAYITRHLRIKAGTTQFALHFEGYQVEGEAAWCYFSAPAVQQPRNIEVFNDLLYQYKKEQVNIIHVKMGNNKKSERLAFPDDRIQFDF